MARIDGIIILDTNGKPLITSHFPSHPPSYPAVHIDAFNHALARSRAAEPRSTDSQLDPVLWVNALNRQGGNVGAAGAALAHIEREGLRYLVPVSEEVNPLFAFAFLEAFLDTLGEYLGEVTEMTVKDNFDIVYMLIEEMLDEGHPMTMETNMLKEIVLPPSMMRKLLNAAGVSGLQSHPTAPFTAPIPWRKPGVRHSQSEIYFDIEETLDAIIDRRGKLLSSAVWGRISCNSRLSGNPDLILSFANAKIMQNCAFHPCIRYNRWTQDGVLSFIPPDGRFKLLEYAAAPGVMSAAQLPVSLKADLTVDDSGGRFSLSLGSRVSSQPLEDITVSIFLGTSATSVSATTTGDRRSMGHVGAPSHSGGGADSKPDGYMGGGSWEFDPHTQLLRWTLSSLVANERSPTLIGSFSATSRPSPDSSFDVIFSIPNYAYSGVRVDQLKVSGDVGYKPFKGVRLRSRSGRVEVRW